MEEKLTYTQKKHLEERQRKKETLEKYKKYSMYLLGVFLVFLLAQVTFGLLSLGENQHTIPLQGGEKQTVGIITNRKEGVDYSSIFLTRGELVSILVLYLGKDTSDYDEEQCFRDIENSPYRKEICYALKKDWIQGKDDGLFYPNDIINHAQGLKLILNFLGENVPQKAYENTYKDIDRSLWYATYAEYAKRKGIIDQEVEYFYPEESISLEQVHQYVLKIEQVQKK